ncbi:forkhead box protein G1 [Biomphalaria glabrata]|nr:forkhead box protein G1 [Biomphalaria glabrata]
MFGDVNFFGIVGVTTSKCAAVSQSVCPTFYSKSSKYTQHVFAHWKNRLFINNNEIVTQPVTQLMEQEVTQSNINSLPSVLDMASLDQLWDLNVILPSINILRTLRFGGILATVSEMEKSSFGRQVQGEDDDVANVK